MAKEKTKAIDYKSFKKQLDGRTIGSMYIFTGSETFLRDYCLTQLKKQLVEGVCEQFNHHTFAGESLDLNQLATAIDTYPMMSDRSLVVVSDYDIFDQNEENRNWFMEIIGDVPDYCCLLFVYDTISYKADGRYKKLCAALDAVCTVVEFSQQSPADLNSWITRKFKSLGRTISRENAEYMVFLCGGLMTNLNQEIEKISAFSPVEDITRDIINEIAEPTTETVVFDMTNAIADKKYTEALTKLRYLYQKKEEPIGLLAVLSSQLRQFYLARLALAEGKNAAYLQQLWGISSYAAGLRVSSAKRFDTKWCQEALKKCADTDLKMKSTGYDRELLLEMLILQLSAK